MCVCGVSLSVWGGCESFGVCVFIGDDPNV